MPVTCTTCGNSVAASEAHTIDGKVFCSGCGKSGGAVWKGLLALAGVLLAFGALVAVIVLLVWKNSS